MSDPSRSGWPGMLRRRLACEAPATRTRAPLASSSASIWALRLENARSCARLKPSISRVLLRSGPQHTPNRNDNERCSWFW